MPELASPSPPTARRQLIETRAPVADCSQGRGWASPAWGADCLCPTQWEKSQLDEEFLHSVENVCGCAKYECGEWGREARGVEPGWARCACWVPVTVAILHAQPVKAPVCLSRELGVMLPGQTVVELSADGVCHTSRCTDVLDPLTSFYQINTTSVLCDVHCEAVGAGQDGGGQGQRLPWVIPGAPGIRGVSRFLDKSEEETW